ncbi:hypothetical protein BCR34DRAFT_605666 [Clohesyomyces aquaticus]|uniref:DUF7580 domain-containing protein n=1 Tax=Clohesyomyces aquaticus TaxID=1231657 RepID=A0A1Y1YW68_9PLEO|nr:hypothetical protein BCR34DRAFT_605666 [Clohesyomyces aquaticus]
MVTGVETAGLVLGSIPLVLAGLEFYVKGIAVTKRYWRYREEFKTLLVELRTENTLCVNSINILLKGVVRDDDMADFLANPCGERWKEEKFDRSLKDRLGSSYVSFIETIKQMNRTIERFKRQLKLDAEGHPQFTDVKSFKEYYRRLKFSLKKTDYCDLMSRLRQANLSLYRLTTQTITLETPCASSKKDKLAISKFGIIHDRAQGFHAALRSGWKCACHTNHSVSLRLEPRMDDRSSDDESDGEEGSMKNPFHVVFRYGDQHSNQHTSAHRPWVWEEADVRVECQASASPRMTAISSSKGVRFASQAKQAVKAALEPNPNLRPIQDLCSAICNLKNPQRDVCLSLLASEIAKQKYGILIFPLETQPSDPEAWSVSSLRDVLKDPKFTKRERLRLAVTLASAVLQLHETPWLEENWGNDKILFKSHCGETVYDHPFVSQRFSHAIQLPQSPQSPNLMSRIIRNRTLYALGVSLIELWYSKPIRELYCPDDGSPYSGNASVDLLTEWNTANRMVDDLYSDAGAKYGDAVRRCIRCEFDRRTNSLDDVAFQQAVYQGVVAELKENFEFLF